MITVTELTNEERAMLRTIPCNRGFRSFMRNVKLTIDLWKGKPVICNCSIKDDY